MDLFQELNNEICTAVRPDDQRKFVEHMVHAIQDRRNAGPEGFMIRLTALV